MRKRSHFVKTFAIIGLCLGASACVGTGTTQQASVYQTPQYSYGYNNGYSAGYQQALQRQPQYVTTPAANTYVVPAAPAAAGSQDIPIRWE